MHEEEIQFFVQALKNAKDEFYLDSLKMFRQLIDEFPNSELVDDSYFNIGLCYFNMNQFEKAIENFRFVIENHSDATISILEGGNEFGRTSAKCYLGIINCYLGLDEIERANEFLEILKTFDDSFILLEDDKKEFFYSIGEKAIKTYKNLKN